MPTVDEALANQSPLAADLKAGLDAISANQTVRFTRYVRLVLPLDGYVFWVKADLLSASALLNASPLNVWAPNQAQRIAVPATYLDAAGSLHYSTETKQEEAQTYGLNRVVFTSKTEIQDLNEIASNELYIGQIDAVRFAFSARGSFYRQAGLYHYVGMAIYPDMGPQIVDAIDGFDASNVIVSNSLPIWLGLNGYASVEGFANPLTLYPSFLVPANLAPPFGGVHIAPETTRAIAGAPLIGATGSHSQLVQERVKITLFGLRNFNAMDFVDAVNAFSLETDLIGIMNQPTIRDEKRTQAELGTIAMKKSIEYDVNYYQGTARNVARTLIAQAFVAVTPQDA